MKYLVFSILLFASCSGNDKAGSKDPLIGKWDYIRAESMDGKSIDLNDSIQRIVHTQNTGLTLHFTKDSIFRVTRKDSLGRENMTAEQRYEVPENRKIIIIRNKGTSDDSFIIEDLSDTLLKINMIYNSDETLVFRKRNSK